MVTHSMIIPLQQAKGNPPASGYPVCYLLVVGDTSLLMYGLLNIKCML